MSVVFLIGMPGVGKTHWGRIWSRAYNFQFHDLDELVELAAGRPIAEIIESAGEPAFRALETAVLIGAVNRSAEANAIISCGGGTPAFGQNLRLMLDCGCVVYLHAPAALILKQLQASEVERPLLKRLSLERLNALFEQRKYYYEQAHFSLPVSTAEPATFAEIIELCLNRRS